MASETASSAVEVHFATPDAPYLSYLSALSRDWHEASQLKDALDQMMKSPKLKPTSRMKTAAGRYMPKTENLVVAEILDIKVDSIGNISNVTTTARINENQISSSKAGATAVNNFSSFLQKCTSDVHTRVVILQDEMDDAALEALFFAQILGVELDLLPSQVSILAKIPGIQVGCSPQHSFMELPDLVMFDNPNLFHDRDPDTAAYIGQRQMGLGKPHLVVIHMSRHSYQLSQSLRALDINLRLPPKYSDFVSEEKSQERMTENYCASVRFADLIRSSTGLGLQLEPDDPCMCWLSALVSVHLLEYGNLYASVQEHRSKGARKVLAMPRSPQGSNRWRRFIDDTWQKAEEMEAMRDHLDAANNQDMMLLHFLRNATDNGRKQILMFQRCCTKSCPSEFEAATTALDRLWSHINDTVEEMKVLLDIQHQKKTMMASEQAIEESKSAVAVTVLAFFFIPISLASSIYGMNVKEINDTGHSIWEFAVTAIIMLSISGLVWSWWRGWRIMKTAIHWGSFLPRPLRFLLTFVTLFTNSLNKFLDRAAG